MFWRTVGARVGGEAGMLARVNVKSTHQSFAGIVRTSTDGKTTLIYNPNDLQHKFIEVRSQDVGLKESLPVIVTEEGELVSCHRVWVRKGSIVKRIEPFKI